MLFNAAIKLRNLTQIRYKCQILTLPVKLTRKRKKRSAFSNNFFNCLHQETALFFNKSYFIDMLTKAFNATNRMCFLYHEKAELEELGKF